MLGIFKSSKDFKDVTQSFHLRSVVSGSSSSQLTGPEQDVISRRSSFPHKVTGAAIPNGSNILLIVDSIPLLVNGFGSGEILKNKVIC